LSFQRGFKAEANRISLRVREQMGLSPIHPIDPVEVCAHFEIALFKLSDLDCDISSFLGINRSAFSAVTIPCGFQTAIVHNDTHHPNRRRSNICHELAHCFLGHRCAPPLTESGERTRDGGLEAEAHFLAGALLIPNEAALHIVRNGLILTAPQIYGVSQSMLTYRLRVSGAHTIHSRFVRAVGGASAGVTRRQGGT
jgi:IrrE N-terminal-like domain